MGRGRHYGSVRSTTSMELGWRGVAVVGSVAVVFAACDGPSLVDQPTGAVNQQPAQQRAGGVTIPPDVVAPVLNCGGGALAAIPIQMPCELGFSPVSEVDCSLGGAAAGQKLKFMLGFSLPDASAHGYGAVVLGTPTRFHPMPLPGGSPVLIGQYAISDISGTVAFTELSPSVQTFDGWFPHLVMLLTGSDGSIVSCSLEEGRFTAVPGDYL